MGIPRRATEPGNVRLYLATAVVAQHLGVPWIGALCVLLFFILSGYWICTLWKLKYRLCRHPYLVFILSRYWRLLPVYLTCVFLAGLCIWRFSGWWPSWTTHFTDPRWVLSTLLILGCASQPHMLPPVWSLDIEMQFYLLAPAVIALTAFTAVPAFRKTKAAGLFGLCILGFLWLPLATNLGTYLLFFVTGCALAHTRWKPSPALVFPCALLALAVFLTTLWLVETRPGGPHGIADVQGVRLPSLACVALMVPFLALSLQTRSDHLDRILGDMAYPIYLFHYVPFLMLDHLRVIHAAPVLLQVALNLLLMTGGSLGIYFLLDRPIDRMRRAYIEREVTLGGQKAAPLGAPAG